MGGEAPSSNSWPILMFFAVVLGGPWLIWKLLSSMTGKRSDATSWQLGQSTHYAGQVLYDFNRERQDELSVRAGQNIRLAPKELQPRVRGWLLGSVDGEKDGLVPASYIRVLGLRNGGRDAIPREPVTSWRVSGNDWASEMENAPPPAAASSELTLRGVLPTNNAHQSPAGVQKNQEPVDAIARKDTVTGDVIVHSSEEPSIELSTSGRSLDVPLPVRPKLDTLTENNASLLNSDYTASSASKTGLSPLTRQILASTETSLAAGGTSTSDCSKESSNQSEGPKDPTCPAE